MSETNGHIFTNFDVALRDLRDGVLKMASLTSQNLENAITGLLERNPERCSEAIADDDEIDNFERTIDGNGFAILIRFGPVAGDLREVLSSMKIANNLERISDESENIARNGRKILKQREMPEIHRLEPLYAAVSEMVRDSVRAFSEGDVQLSLSLKARASELSKEHAKLAKALTKMVDGDSENAKTLLRLIYIVRSLDRIGDLAKNIAEDAVFNEASTDVRHLSPQEAAAEVEEMGA